MAPSKPPNKKAPNAGNLLNDAETLYAAGSLSEAISVAFQALEMTGEGGDHELRALNLLGILHVEIGDVEDARGLFERAALIDQNGTMDEKVGGGPEKFLFLAQLSDEGGKDSVGWFERGASALRTQIQALADVSSRTPEQEATLDEKQKKLGGVLCAVAEVYMTDLSWEADAEDRCEALITEAMLIAPQSPETWQTVANVRISQERIDDAKKALKQSMELWQDLPFGHPGIPDFPSRISLCRLLLEVELEDDALKVLEILVSDDDQSVEAWYLGGWCLYILGEKLRSSSNQPNGDSEEWENTWISSRRWLTRCLNLYQQQEYEDDRLGEHATELRSNINKEIGEPAEGEDDWDDASDEDEDEDEEMQG